MTLQDRTVSTTVPWSIVRSTVPISVGLRVTVGPGAHRFEAVLLYQAGSGGISTSHDDPLGRLVTQLDRHIITGSPSILRVMGKIRQGPPGEFELRVAQESAHSDPTVILSGSVLRVWAVQGLNLNESPAGEDPGED